MNIPEFSAYTITKEGVIMKDGVIINQRLKKGNPIVRILNDSEEMKEVSVSKLVATTYIKNPKNAKTVNHIDGNLENNNVDNLQWGGRKVSPKTRETKAILKFKNGVFVERYESVKAAAEAVGKAASSISGVCDTNKSIGGFHWKSEEEKKDIDLSEFVEVVDCPDYMISKTGEVYSKKSKILLKPTPNADTKRLYITIEGKTCYVNHLMLNTFIGNPDGKSKVRHKDNDPLNNELSNLEWF